jgi:hypothetical protein
MYVLDNGDRLYGFLENWIFVQRIENHTYWKKHFLDQGIDDPEYLEKYKVHNNHENLLGTTFHEGKNAGMDYSYFEAEEVVPRCKTLIEKLKYTKSVKEFCWWHQNYAEGGYHSPHSHANCLIAGIYLLELQNENTTIFYSKDKKREHSFQLNNVQEGDLILFDPKIWHSVDPSDGKKISICFNAI